MEIVMKKPTVPGAEKPRGERPPVYRGKPGPQGPAGTIEIAQVVTIEPSDPARVENIGDNTSAKLILYIPKGDPGNRGEPGPVGTAGPAGHAATVEIARVVTIEPSDSARVENIGDSTNAKLILYIPKGDQGDRGEPGPAVEITDDIIQAIAGELDLTPELVGLGNVDNTSDMDKPVSNAQAEAIEDAKEAGMDAQGDIDTHVANTNNPHGVTIAQIGLGNVDNTSDMDKPVSNAQAAAIADAKKAGTDAQEDIDAHVADTNNPHRVTCAQIGASPAILDPTTVGCYYRLLNTVEGATREWINPPMMLGVEYRTTERHNGAVVYAVRLTVGELLNNGTTTTSLPSVPAEIVEIYGTAKSDAYTEEVTFPILTSAGAVGARLVKSATKQIAAKTFADYSGYTATATVKYTKAKEPNA